MSTQISLKINNAKTTIKTFQLEAAQTLTLTAQDKVHYQFVDEQTGFAPENMMIKREGDNLLVAFEGSEISQPNLIIKNYYQMGADNLLIGQYENGQIYPYVPESGLKSDAVTLLGEQQAAGQALGGEPIKALWAISPWLLALIPLAGLGLAFTHHHKGHSPAEEGFIGTPRTADNTPPAAPTITPNEDGSVTITPPTDSDTKQVTVTYTDEEGNTHTVISTKDDEGKWSITDPDNGDTNVSIDTDTGVITIPANEVQDGSEVTTNASDNAGNQSEDSTATAPTDPKPTVTFTDDANNDGYLNNSEVGSDGETNVKIDLPTGTEAGDTLVITVTTENNDGSTTTSTVTATVTAEDIENGYTTTVTVDGNTAKITVDAYVEDPNGNKSDSGDSSVQVDTQVPGGTDEDGDGNKDLDNQGKGSHSPTVSFTEDQDGNNTLNSDEVGTDGTTSVKIELPAGTEAGDTLVITVTTTNNDGSTSTTTVNVTVTEEDLTNGYTTNVPVSEDTAKITVEAYVEDPAGNQSATGSNEVSVDINAPSAPTITPNEDGSVTITPPTDSDTKQVTVTYTDEDGTSHTVIATKDDEGKWSITDPNNDNTNVIIDENTGVITIPANEVKDGSTVTTNATDNAGNQSDNSTATAPTDPKPTVTFTEDANNDGYLNNKEVGEDNQTGVKIDLPTGTEAGDTLVITVTTTNSDGSTSTTTTTVTLTEEDIASGYTTNVPVSEDTAKITVEAYVEDPAGNQSATGSSEVSVDISAPSAPTITPNEDGSVTITPPTDSDTKQVTVTYTDEDGTSHTVIATKDDEGKWSITDPNNDNTNVIIDENTGVITIPANEVKDGSTVTTNASDNAGNTSEDSTSTAPTDPKPTVTFTDDANNDGYLNNKEVGNDGETSVKIDLPTGTAAGDTLVITVTTENNDGTTSTTTETVTVTEDNINNGYTTTVTVDDNTAKITVDAYVQDPQGNKSDSGDSSIAVDTKVPSLTITVDNVASDNVVNLDESDSDSVPVTGTVTGDFNAGDTVTVTLNNQRYTTTVGENGSWTVNVKGTDLVDDSDKQIEVSVTTTDNAGNTATATSSKTYQVDTNAGIDITSIAGENQSDSSTPYATIDNNDYSQGFSISGTTSDVEAGQTVTVTVMTSDGSSVVATYTTTVGTDGSWSVSVEANASWISNGTAYQFTATVSDQAGNVATDTDSTNATELSQGNTIYLARVSNNLTTSLGINDPLNETTQQSSTTEANKTSSDFVITTDYDDIVTIGGQGESQGTYNGYIDSIFGETYFSTGAGNDTVTAKTLAFNSDAGSVFVDLGSGDDQMTISNFTAYQQKYGTSNNAIAALYLGTGNDTLQVTGDIGYIAAIVSRESSTITINGSLSGVASMFLGNGDDKVTITGSVRAEFGGYNDTSSGYTHFQQKVVGSLQSLATKYTDSDLSTALTEHNLSNLYGATYYTSYNDQNTNINYLNTARIDLGDGNNELTTGAVQRYAILSGSGNDTMTFEKLTGAYVNTGAGNDNVTINTFGGHISQMSTQINLGAGDDKLTINSVDYSGSSGNAAGAGSSSSYQGFLNLIGGEGTDVLTIGSGVTISLQALTSSYGGMSNTLRVYDFEYILGNGTLTAIRGSTTSMANVFGKLSLTTTGATTYVDDNNVSHTMNAYSYTPRGSSVATTIYIEDSITVDFKG